MRVKFNKFERVAGLFVMTALVGCIVGGIGVAVKQGWFDIKVHYRTHFNSANGLHPGTEVKISGLKAGSIDSVELQPDNSVLVEFSILGKFQPRIKTDSKVSLMRPFIIGEKIMDVQAGSPEASTLADGETIASEESLDLMDVVSGRELGNYLNTLTGLVENLKIMAEAFADPERTKSVIKVFDRIDPMTQNINEAAKDFINISKQVTKKEAIGRMVSQMADASEQMNKVLPVMADKGPQMAKDISMLVENMNIITEQFKAVLPAVAEIAPELPSVSRRAIEALNETVVVLKAMEKSFMLRGNAEEVRREEAARQKAMDRTPAQEK